MAKNSLSAGPPCSNLWGQWGASEQAKQVDFLGVFKHHGQPENQSKKRESLASERNILFFFDQAS
jgi:hypothetical protein